MVKKKLFHATSFFGLQTLPMHGCEERMGIPSGTKAHHGASTATVAVGEKAHLGKKRQWLVQKNLKF